MAYIVTDYIHPRVSSREILNSKTNRYQLKSCVKLWQSKNPLFLMFTHLLLMLPPLQFCYGNLDLKKSCVIFCNEVPNPFLNPLSSTKENYEKSWINSPAFFISDFLLLVSSFAFFFTIVSGMHHAHKVF